MFNIEETDSANPPHYFKKFTIAVFGDSGVEKSSIVRLLVSQEHITKHEPTVEDFYVKYMTHRNKAYEVHIIDTSGTYEFPAMRRIAMEKADAAVLVYSLDKPNSFSKLDRYMEEITKCCDDRNRKIPVSNMQVRFTKLVGANFLQLLRAENQRLCSFRGEMEMFMAGYLCQVQP